MLGTLQDLLGHVELGGLLRNELLVHLAAAGGLVDHLVMVGRVRGGRPGSSTCVSEVRVFVGPWVAWREFSPNIPSFVESWDVCRFCIPAVDCRVCVSAGVGGVVHGHAGESHVPAGVG